MEEGPPDPIFGLLEAYNKDKRATRVNLTVGAYRDGNGRPLVLNVVKQVRLVAMQTPAPPSIEGGMGNVFMPFLLFED